MSPLCKIEYEKKKRKKEKKTDRNLKTGVNKMLTWHDDVTENGRETAAY